ncbi:flagellar M-ring protein FliF [Lichenicola cladoniae]|uniref:Flagellar M-ring protein n=1 Tax=Lichenicola cladoniae TaxID=1484109 RepID=A0A6M8HHD6_9PROT|nr:flagellar basal-body MS-ring/collar protein FliF [Lichenicola cladoniae]NPD69619.1 flagellar M-ring protein FliF [Acetobacteraceae bacterium]QKE88729.1 flagellar M-ring protein FliF [Lichenicola cladoniae]
MNPLLEGLKALGPAKLAAMAAVAIGILTMLAVLVSQGGARPQMALLYGDLDLHEAGQMAEQLEKAHIPHELGSQDDRILVPSDQVAAARLLLAKGGLPSGGSVGYEIFDRGDNLTATQFEQTINQTRALEGELARSIRLITGVRGARVHLVLPHREPFASEQMPAQASVLLSMSGAARMDPEGVQAVLNLVSAAVPGLKPQNIAIIDNRGSVLARAGNPIAGSSAAQSVDELRQSTELRLARAVEEMLEPSLGAEHVRAEAAVTMTSDQVRETQETFDPSQQVLRSQQTVSDKNRNSDGATNTSVQNNLPNANAGQTPSGSQGDRQEETNNYEIGKTVRTLVRDQPRLTRISLAVMVDGTVSKGADGKPAWQIRSKDELDRISTLVKSAIGYDAKRGDIVTVVSMPFTVRDLPEAPAPAGLLGLHLDREDIVHIGQNLLLGTFMLLALILVVRPMVLRLTTVPALIAGPTIGGTALEAGPMLRPALSGPAHATGDDQAMLADQSLITLANIDGRLRAASIRQIVDLAGRHPEESLTIVRGWLAKEPT